MQIADEILNKNYRAFWGVEEYVKGTTVKNVQPGTLADLNGIIKGDRILEMDGAQISDFMDMNKALGKLIYKYGSTVNIKLKRKGRIIEIAAKLIYPEVEKTRLILQEAKAKMAETSYVADARDKQPPLIKILEPKAARGVKIVAKQNVTFVILASDDKGVENVLVNDIPTTASEAGILEKTFLPGDVKKYTNKCYP